MFVEVTHSAFPAEHPHCTVCPQLLTRETPHAPAHGSVGVQHEPAKQTRPDAHVVGHCTERPQLSVTNVPHWFPHAVPLLGAQHWPFDRHTWLGFVQVLRNPSRPQLTV